MPAMSPAAAVLAAPLAALLLGTVAWALGRGLVGWFFDGSLVAPGPFAHAVALASGLALGAQALLLLALVGLLRPPLLLAALVAVGVTWIVGRRGGEAEVSGARLGRGEIALGAALTVAATLLASYPPTERVLPAVADPAALARRLRALGADHLLVPAAALATVLPDDSAASRWFTLVASAPAGRAYRVRAP